MIGKSIINEVLYSEREKALIVKTLEFAQKHGRIKVFEWRNFIDYDIIPLLREFWEEVEKFKKKRIEK